MTDNTANEVINVLDVVFVTTLVATFIIISSACLWMFIVWGRSVFRDE